MTVALSVICFCIFIILLVAETMEIMAKISNEIGKNNDEKKWNDLGHSGAYMPISHNMTAQMHRIEIGQIRFDTIK